MLPKLDIPRLYQSFDAPVVDCDCGQKCAPFNPHGVPFCCDICQAVPAVYGQEWDYLQAHTDLWHVWRGDECVDEACDPAELAAETPENMLLLACLGAPACVRPMRSISCRQFPFFPYITSRDRFIGLAYHWDFEPSCWVISHLGSVTERYHREFIRFYDEMFAVWEEDFDSYAVTSEEMRDHFSSIKRRIPILHRNGGFYLLSPDSERMERAAPEGFRQFGPYRDK